MRVLLVLLLTGLVTILANTGASAADRQAKVALLIGNAKYNNEEHVMTDVANDSQELADELRRDGFEVDKQSNLSGDGMRQALDRFYSKIQPGSVALLFFDGFGIQSQRQTYLLGTDAAIWEEKDVARDGFNLEKIIAEMNNRGASVKLVIIDAARRNSYDWYVHHYSAGLAPAVAPSNTLLLYSAALNQVLSSTHADHGLFVTELIREIRAPGTTAEQAFNNTQRGVVAATSGAQVPWTTSSMTTDFSFFGGPVSPPQPPIIQPSHEPERPACTPAIGPTPPTSQDLDADSRIREYSHRIEQNSNDRTSYYKRGQLYAIKGAYPQAVLDFNKAIAMNGQDPEAYNNRCWARAASGDLQNALHDCDQALRIKPDLYDALDSRGLVNLRLGHYSDAITDYNASLDKNPRSVTSLFGRGLATKLSGGDGTSDIEQATNMDRSIASEFAGYGVNGCPP
jgi:tetratricopeptide (TPR) repeat protein